ncbi:epoxide hydrolase [Trichoderma arundinaceum]|uniref:Epoxide hydrolase n=1 Tax=Trichoderma arundinaceum TaxID=490622 RepID=A0A395NAS3_TRIAR|nr:epoxide hydrolase [Trichoderma arundinaceum]
MSLDVCKPVADAVILGYGFPFHKTQLTTFEISIDQALTDETLTKVRFYHPSLDLEDKSNNEWIEGTPQAEVISLAVHWAQNYDCPKYSHSIPPYFVHETCSNDDAMPLLLLHGWPSSHLEWSKVIKPLTSPEKLTEQHYHVVAPDLPGFSFSPAPSYAGLTSSQMGFAFDYIMHALGYDKYGIFTTDLGWWVGMWMAQVVPDSLIGHMTDFWMQAPNSTYLQQFAQNKTTSDEAAYINSYQV